ncbi:glycosyltransferase family 4 protein [Pseudoduganella aquatica]|uniref:glycosyltransferase family 4 protein n=1 Tax=Pseudoduganella aquatica TaxID=2660641 RepID=UPI001E5278C8|nr:glycosyltransferase family 4 protein [Pseudoduganella aquatica]
MLRIAIVTNILAPYRTPVFSALAAQPGVTVRVIACAEQEDNRLWDYPPPRCELAILRPRVFKYRERYIHCNPDVFQALAGWRPDVVVTDGFNPTHLFAFVYARRRGIPHVTMTDGTADSERTLSALHRLVRRFVFARSHGHVAASAGGLALFDAYRLPAQRRFLSCLCVDNAAYGGPAPAALRPYDLMFCGRMEAVKDPLFALAVALELARRLRRPVRMLFVGSGTLDAQVRAAAALYPGLVEAHFAGFLSQAELPGMYRAARVFLFPSRWDPWGVVVNEACAAGMPVLASPHAGAAHELVRDGENGYVCGLDVQRWADRAQALLQDEAHWVRCSERSRALVADYTFERAGAGLASACRNAVAGNAAAQTDGRYRSWPSVVIVERQLLNYRIGLYQQLRALLAERGIALTLLVGQGTPAEQMKRNEASLPWAVPIPTHYALRYRVCWQPYGRQARAADMVVVMHENKILYNLWLMLVARPSRLAFWGHGANLQSERPGGWKERFKRWTVGRADWWFAYTDMSARLIEAAGFPRERTTVVENAADTTEMMALCADIGELELARWRARLGLGGGPVGLYLGSLYHEKRLDFLLAAARRVRAALPGFELLIVGAGPDQAALQAAAASDRWIHFLGPLSGRDKCVALRLADVMLNPGLVGLGILDSFASGKPMLTTDCGLHSPEIAYLESGRNGIMTPNDLDSYAAAAVAVLRNPAQLAALSEAARASGGRYTVENMARRLCQGIEAALAQH